MDSEANCEKCRKQIERMQIEMWGKRMFSAKYCQECCDEYDRELKLREEAERHARNEERWCKLCPPSYRNTEPDRLPQKALVRAMEWRWCDKGLVLHGKTGSGKTRIAYMLLRRLFDEGRRIRVMTAAEFRRGYGNAAMEGDSESWVAGVSRVEALLLDDLGQTKMTDSSEEALLDVLDVRCRNLLPTFYTTQYTGSDLLEQFTREQRGQAIIRRMREYTDAIYVKKEGEEK